MRTVLVYNAPRHSFSVRTLHIVRVVFRRSAEPPTTEFILTIYLRVSFRNN